MDFFCEKCTITPIESESFGIVDCDKGGYAYPVFDHEDSWVALVKNENKVEVSFVAIDKCVLSDSDATGIGRCDAMLYTSNRLYLVELKKVRSGWKGDAIQQLIDTIDSIFHFHAEQLQSFRVKKAFVCNKRHPHFTEVDNELQARIYREYKFRIDVQAEVIIFD